MAEKSTFVVSSQWLEENLSDPNLVVIDGSWYLPAQERDARAEYEAAHIPGAIFFDHDAVVDRQSDQPHAFPPPSEFARHASAMGIARTNTLVVYDGPGMFSAPRVWWILRAMGVHNVFVLAGGMDGWKASGKPITSEPTKIANRTFEPLFDNGQVVNFPAMQGIVTSGVGQIADARSAERFQGKVAEPREGMRRGHMPGAKNLPFNDLIENGDLKDLGTLETIIKDAGLDITKPIVTTCGSGVTAAVINLALSSLGRIDSRLYDGSWSEWGGREDTAVVQGK